jgi:hypothetical protein
LEVAVPVERVATVEKEVSKRINHTPFGGRDVNSSTNPRTPSPIGQKAPSNFARKSPDTVLEKLGVLTKKYPIHVAASAVAGAFLLVLSMVGTARLFAPKSAKSAVATATVTHFASTQTVIMPETVAVQNPPETTLPTGPVEGAAIETPDVRIAISHLFSGRLPEAEQAYRELATRFPQNPSFQVATRILTKRNSADCRSLSDTNKFCPTVKP